MRPEAIIPIGLLFVFPFVRIQDLTEYVAANQREARHTFQDLFFAFKILILEIIHASLETIQIITDCSHVILNDQPQKAFAAVLVCGFFGGRRLLRFLLLASLVLLLLLLHGTK
jgi:hypothetical protein